jgi:hypothetical protein
MTTMGKQRRNRGRRRAALDPHHSLPLLTVEGTWTAALLGFAFACSPLPCSARKL